MKEILQFDATDLYGIYMTKMTIMEFRDALNRVLREKAEASRELEEQSRPVHRPNCF